MLMNTKCRQHRVSGALSFSSSRAGSLCFSTKPMAIWEFVLNAFFLLKMHPSQLPKADLNRLPDAGAVLAGSGSFRPSAAAKVDVRREKHKVPISGEVGGRGSDPHLDFRRNTSSSWQLKP